MDENSCILCGTCTTATGSNEAMDGLVCPACLGKLSPFFSELDLAETDELKNQLMGRERNRAAVQSFRPSRQFGAGTTLLVDDSAGTFLVTDRQDYRSGNPDVIRLADVMDCSCSLETEKEDLGGKRSRYSYVFQIVVTLEKTHPYLPDCEFSFPLNTQPLVFEGAKGGFLGMGAFDPEDEPDFQALDRTAQLLCDVLNREEDPESDYSPYRVQPGQFAPAAPQPPVPEVPAAAAPAAPTAATVVCPWCGDRVTPAPDNTCPHCTGTLS